MPNSPDTAPCWICLNGLVHCFTIHGFRPTWPCLIIKVLATRAKLLDPSDYWEEINCTFTFYTTNVFWLFPQHYGPVQTLNKSSQIRLHCMFICMNFKWYTERRNAQHVSAPTTTILPTTAGTFHSFSCFRHMIYIYIYTKTRQNFWLTLIFSINVPDCI